MKVQILSKCDEYGFVQGIVKHFGKIVRSFIVAVENKPNEKGINGGRIMFLTVGNGVHPAPEYNPVEGWTLPTNKTDLATVNAIVKYFCVKGNRNDV